LASESTSFACVSSPSSPSPCSPSGSQQARGPWLGWCWLALADVRSGLGEDDSAAESLDRARKVFELMGDARGLELCK